MQTKFLWIFLGISQLIVSINTAVIIVDSNKRSTDFREEYNGDVEIAERSKRSGGGYMRGQTQSQYLNFDKPEQNGKAEAEATEGGSRSTVSGTHGMGQAQSQFSKGDCSECAPTSIYDYPSGSPDPLTLTSGGGGVAQPSKIGMITPPGGPGTIFGGGIGGGGPLFSGGGQQGSQRGSAVGPGAGGASSGIYGYGVGGQPGFIQGLGQPIGTALTLIPGKPSGIYDSGLVLPPSVGTGLQSGGHGLDMPGQPIGPQASRLPFGSAGAQTQPTNMYNQGTGAEPGVVTQQGGGGQPSGPYIYEANRQQPTIPVHLSGVPQTAGFSGGGSLIPSQQVGGGEHTGPVSGGIIQRPGEGAPHSVSFLNGPTGGTGQMGVRYIQGGGSGIPSDTSQQPSVYYGQPFLQTQGDKQQHTGGIIPPSSGQMGQRYANTVPSDSRPSAIYTPGTGGAGQQNGVRPGEIYFSGAQPVGLTVQPSDTNIPGASGSTYTLAQPSRGPFPGSGGHGAVGQLIPGTNTLSTGSEATHFSSSGGATPTSGGYIQGNSGLGQSGPYILGAGDAGYRQTGVTYMTGAGGVVQPSVGQTGGGYGPGTMVQPSGVPTTGSGGIYIPSTGVQTGGVYVPSNIGQPSGIHIPGTGGAGQTGLIYVPSTGGSVQPSDSQTGIRYIPVTSEQPSGTYVQSPQYSPGSRGIGQAPEIYIPGAEGATQADSIRLPSAGGVGQPSIGVYTPGSGAGGQQTGVSFPGAGGSRQQTGVYTPGIGSVGQQSSVGARQPGGIYNPGGQNVVQPSGGVQTVPGVSSGNPSNLLNTVGTGGAEDAFSQAESTINNGQASASAQGKKNGGTAKTQVSGTYSSTGTFSASASTSDNDRAANAQVSGSSEGAMSQSQGQGGPAQSQSQVQVNAKTGGTKASSQSGGVIHQSQSEVQANDKGGLADAQSSGPGQTSSQAQIGFRPRQDGGTGSTTSVGGGQASAQSGAHSGQSQSQIQGKSKLGISYHGAAQSASGTKEQVATYREQNRELFHSISQFGDSDAVTDRVEGDFYRPALTSESDHLPDLQLKASQTNKEAATNGRSEDDLDHFNDDEDDDITEEEYNDDEEYEGGDRAIKMDGKPNSDSQTATYINTAKNDHYAPYHVYTQSTPNQTQQAANANPSDKYTVVQNQNGRVQRYPIRTTTEVVPNGFRGTVNVEKKIHTKSLTSHKTENTSNSASDASDHDKLRTPDSYVTVTKSITGSMDNSKNPPQENKNFQSTYYTKSSTCGYFTFSCNIVYGANGRSKICRPKAPTNGKC